MILIGLLFRWGEVYLEKIHSQASVMHQRHDLCLSSVAGRTQTINLKQTNINVIKPVLGIQTFEFYKCWICKFMLPPLRWSVCLSWDYKLPLTSKLRSIALQRGTLVNNIEWVTLHSSIIQCQQ